MVPLDEPSGKSRQRILSRLTQINISLLAFLAFDSRHVCIIFYEQAPRSSSRTPFITKVTLNKYVLPLVLFLIYTNIELSAIQNTPNIVQLRFFFSPLLYYFHSDFCYPRKLIIPHSMAAHRSNGFSKQRQSATKAS